MKNQKLFEKCLTARHPCEINEAIEDLIQYTDQERKNKKDCIDSFSKEIFENAIRPIFSLPTDVISN